MKVLINENCINCGHCYTEVDTAGVVFKEGDGVAVVVEGADFAANKEMIQKAVDECPVAAIEMVDEGVAVEDSSEPEIPVESAPEMVSQPLVEPAPVMAQSPAGDDLAVSSEPAPEPIPAQEESTMPVDDEIPLG
ncbi:MAG TPA: ferredoxin [Patescibacteria group bacterium]|nr:ferredoxin [Patescibacteria group bacterium]